MAISQQDRRRHALRDPDELSSGARILVADDNPATRDDLARLLSRYWEIKQVADGSAALAAAHAWSPHLILADVMMPGLDGFALLRALRADEATREIPIILISSLAGEEPRIEGFEAGADDFLVKPFSERELVARIGASLELLRMRKTANAKLREREDREGFLLSFNDALRTLADPTEIESSASRLLGEHLSVNGAMYAEVDGAQGDERGVIRSQYLRRGGPFPGRFLYTPLGEEIIPALRRGDPISVVDVGTDARFSDVERELYRELNIVSYVVVPLVKEGRWLANFGVHNEMARTWTPPEIELVSEVAERTWQTCERARADAALRKSEEHLKLSDRSKDEFLAMLAHELRNFLAPLGNSLQILRRNAEHNTESKPVVDIMDRHIYRMARLVDDLFDIARINRGHIELRRERVAVKDVMEGAIETSMSLIEAGQHRLHVDLPGKTLTVNGDPVRLSQVFANLINNAAKYMNQGGDIWVSATQENGRVKISVKDTGFGIDPYVLENIFDLFSKRPSAERQARDRDGLGIGLTLARRLVELHDGRIYARSKGSNQGSEFIVELPPAAGTTRVDLTQGESPRLTAGVEILVVDDNSDSADSLAMLLNLEGAAVRTVYDAASALEEFKRQKPEVALIDIRMPDINGFEVAERIRRQPEYDDVTLIALTGWGQSRHFRRSRAAGFDHHVTKPPDLEVLKPLLVPRNSPR